MNETFRTLRAKYGIPEDAPRQNMVMIGDFGKDLDDEHALVLTAGLEEMGLVYVRGVVANLAPADDRARLARGTMNRLGMNTHVPVIVGKSCYWNGTRATYESDVPYLARSTEVTHLRPEHRLFSEIGADELTLVLNSALTDAACECICDTFRFCKRVSAISIMGGVSVHGDEIVLDDVGFMSAQIGRNGAANNNFDEAAALYLYRVCQEHGVPMTVLMREAAYACQIPFSIYDQLTETGNIIGATLRDRQKPSITHLWKAANAPEGSEVRGKLPLRCDRAWFVKTFCNGVDPDIDSDGDIWPHTYRFQLYDPMNVIAAVPVLRDRFFTSVEVNVKNTTHRVIGHSKTFHGVKDEESLRQFIIDVETAALKAAV